MRKLRGIALSVLVVTLLLATALSRAAGARGTLVATVYFSDPCPGQGLGIGLAFDGSSLWYSCVATRTDLYRADAHSGKVTATFQIAGGLGALAYDFHRNAIWSVSSKGTDPPATVRLVQLDAAKNVVSSTIRFTASPASPDDIQDGLAYDALDDTLYYSPDGAQTINHYDTSGKLLDTRQWAGTGCPNSGAVSGGQNSGLAIGGHDLYQGADGCSHVWVTDKSTNALQFDFPTQVASDPNYRDEDLECDSDTFAAQNKHVMWSVEAYEPRRARAFEIDFGTCGTGGLPPILHAGTGAANWVILGVGFIILTGLLLLLWVFNRPRRSAAVSKGI